MPRKKAPKPQPDRAPFFEVVPIEEMTPDPSNVRRHGERNRQATDASLAAFGPARSIVLDGRGIVRAGNGTVESARAAGVTEVLVVEPAPGQLVAVRRGDWSPTQAVAYAIADNRTGELAEWDDQGLAETLRSLDSEGFDIEAAGFTGQELEDLIEGLGDDLLGGAGSTEPDPGPQIDRADELLAKWGVEQGQLWEIPSRSTPGRSHRLLCGDSTRAEDVARLMGGEKASLCFTSPPYGQQREYEGGIADWDALMRGVFANLPMADDGQVLVNLGLIHSDGEWMPYWDGWIEWMRGQGWRRFGWYVWDQGPGMPGDWAGRFAPSFEFVFHFNRIAVKPLKARECAHAGEIHHGSGQRQQDGIVRERSHSAAPIQSHAINDSVIRVNRQGASHHAEGHPAPFPLGLPAFILESWEGLAYEPFCGSGTTLVAAEKGYRLCYGIEIAPKYCAVILERLSGMGLSPRLS